MFRDEPGTSEGQWTLLTAEPSLQPGALIFIAAFLHSFHFQSWSGEKRKLLGDALAGSPHLYQKWAPYQQSASLTVFQLLLHRQASKPVLPEIRFWCQVEFRLLRLLEGAEDDHLGGVSPRNLEAEVRSWGKSSGEAEQCTLPILKGLCKFLARMEKMALQETLWAGFQRTSICAGVGNDRGQPTSSGALICIFISPPCWLAMLSSPLSPVGLGLTDSVLLWEGPEGSPNPATTPGPLGEEDRKPKIASWPWLCLPKADENRVATLMGIRPPWRLLSK